MLRKRMILALCVGLTGGGAQALTISDIEDGLSEKKTEAQKDRFWRESENLPLEVKGKVVDATEAGLLLPAIVKLKVNGSSFDVECWLRDSESQSIYDVNLGDTVICSGIFQTYTETLGRSLVVGSAKVSSK